MGSKYPPMALNVCGLSVLMGERRVLDDVNLEVARGTSVAITGPSGSGKTTLLASIAGLVRPDQGTVRVGCVEFSRVPRGKLPGLRLNNIGFVYQFAELLPELSPVENVALPALLQGRSRAAAYEQAKELLTRLGVGAVVSTPTYDLSGGERQRVAVARALITSPPLILADEPTGALDERSVADVADLLFSLPSQWGCGLVVVTHNERVADRADRHYVLHAAGLEPA
jgi:putative ABC transport system ATP-binding protein/lipoprotein-releasing system ATP-binding protein